MKNIYLLMILIFALGCTERNCRCESPIIPGDFNFDVKNAVADSIVANTLDKIEPKPTFYEKNKKLVAQGKLKLIIPKKGNFIKRLDFNPMIADKERILEIKIYKNNKILATKRVGYTAVAYEELYQKDKGNKKRGDVLTLHEISVYSDIKVTIDYVKTGYIRLNDLEIFIINSNIIF